MKFKTPKFWRSNNLLSIILTPFSWLYLLGHITNQALKRRKNYSKKLICVGNLIAGGSGKTPAAIAIAKLLQEQNIKVAFASKNYNGTFLEAKQVEKKDVASEVSDEPILLSKIAPSFVAKKREQAIELACQSDAQVIIVDDGFQSENIDFDLKILVVDSSICFGNKKLLPAGPLRDRLAKIGKSDLIIQIDGDKNSLNELKTYKHRIIIAKRVFTNNLDKRAKYLAFSGIAYPEKFFTSMQENGYKLVSTMGYPDHYFYSKEDMKKLHELAANLQARLVTTEKDAVRIKEHIDVLKMELELQDSDLVQKVILKIL